MLAKTSDETDETETGKSGGDKLRTMKLAPAYNPAADSNQSRLARLEKILGSDLSNDQKLSRILKLFGKRPDDPMRAGLEKLVFAPHDDGMEHSINVMSYIKGIMPPAPTKKPAPKAWAPTPMWAQA